LAEYIHGKGLLFGIYSDAGNETCGGLPGSLDHEEIDAKTFVEWGVDYLKYDNCFSQGRPEQERYQALKNATKGTNKTIFYSICEWGQSDPWLWGPDVGNSWRTSVDINGLWTSILSIIDSQVRITQYGGPGGWNDPDMLAAPLILGCDLNDINDASKALILNKDIISVNQDPLGQSICQVYYKTHKKTSFDIWTGPLIDGYVAILFNRGIDPINITLNFHKHCYLTGEIKVRDLVNQQSKGNFTNTYTAVNIPENGVEFIKLTGRTKTNSARP
ncbi:7020_t:CDS:10, partial [Dentiscutata erythropus]